MRQLSGDDIVLVEGNNQLNVQMMPIQAPVEEGWVSPTGDNGLYNASKARDGDFETYAVIRSEAWSDFLVLTIEPTVCSAISYLMSFSHPSYAAVGLDIDIEYDGTWHNLLDAGPATLPDLSGRLNVITFQPQTITGVRIRAKGCGYPRIFYLREVQLWRGAGLAAEAEFEYVSDVRIKPWPEATSSPNAIFEVDVKNVGNSLGICSGTIYLDTSLQKNTVPISSGLDLIKPGETRTLQAKWQAGAGWSEDDWWFKDGGYIVSEAGCISLKFGRSVYLVSFDIPGQIASGGEFWPTQVIHLAGGGVRPGSLPPNASPNLEGDLFMVILCLRPPRYSGQVPSIEQGDSVSRCNINALHYVTQVLPDGGQQPMGDMQLLTTYSDYTVKGSYEMQILVPHNGGGVVVSVNVPCKASYWTGGAGAINRYLPMPPGTYDVVSFLGWSYQQTGYAPWHIRPIWCYIVGQVQVV
jgi:hypothetical protein